MFTSEKWAMSKWAKEAKGKGATEIILMPSFWNHVVYILDGSSCESSSACRQWEKHTFMKLWIGLQKQSITLFNNNEEKNRQKYDIIDEK